MKLYVLRHARAPSASESAVATDAERPISELGRRELRDILRQAARRRAAPSIILSSPLKRALQTAEEAARLLCPPQGVKVFGPLANEVTGPALWTRLDREAAGQPELLIVGHQPQLGEMVRHLTGDLIELRPGGMAALEPTPDGRAVLLWSLTAPQL